MNHERKSRRGRRRHWIGAGLIVGVCVLGTAGAGQTQQQRGYTPTPCENLFYPIVLCTLKSVYDDAMSSTSIAVENNCKATVDISYCIPGYGCILQCTYAAGAKGTCGVFLHKDESIELSLEKWSFKDHNTVWTKITNSHELPIYEDCKP